MATRINALFESRLPVATAKAYDSGAMVDGAQSAVTTVTVHSGHGIATGDKFLYGLTDRNILVDRVFTAGTVTATTVPFTGAAYSFPDGAILVPLGTDTGGAQNSDGSFQLPNYDGTTVSMYSDSNGDDAITSVTVASNGEAGFYSGTVPCWVLGLSSGNRPVQVLIDVGSASASSGPSLTRGTSFPGAPTLGDEHILVTAGANPDIKYIYMKQADESSGWVEVVSAP